jgi:hypothetical protein
VHPMQAEYPDRSNLGEIIFDRRLRNLYERFLAEIRGLHDEVLFESTRVEVRVFFRNTLLCRVVPYRELFHVQIGDQDPWEIRVRDKATCVRTLDCVLGMFFKIFTHGEPVFPQAG